MIILYRPWNKIKGSVTMAKTRINLCPPSPRRRGSAQVEQLSVPPLSTQPGRSGRVAKGDPKPNGTRVTLTIPEVHSLADRLLAGGQAGLTGVFGQPGDVRLAA